MRKENFQPIPVSARSHNSLLFVVRCWLDLQLATIVKFLDRVLRGMNGKVLDVGAGESPWKELLPDRCTYTGIDVNHAGEYGMKPGRTDIIYYDGRRMPFADASFDNVMCIEVLEHAEYPEELISEISRVLKDGGVLVLTVPFSARRHHLPHDFHRFTLERLGRIFNAHEFVDVHIEERGNDICAIASKLVVLTVRLLKASFSLNVVWSLWLLLLVVPVTVCFVLAAHASIHWGLGASEDPLGYAVRAVRGQRFKLA